MGIDLLTDIFIIFSLSVVVLYICHRLNLPTIVGFLISGILAGPHGLGLISAVHEVEVLAEVGIVLLLFTIGIELSFTKLLKIRKSVLMGGSIQVGLTILVVYIVARQIGYGVGESVFLGFLISLSSTAIVLKLIQERAEVDSPFGSSTLGILIFQDIIIVAMILAVPLLSPQEVSQSEPLTILLLKGLGVILFVFVSAKWIVPRVLFQIVRTRNKEVFLLSIFVICLGVTWATSSAGFSLSIGAFLAGLIISESEYGHEALSHVLPFKDIFTSFFFISIGMLLNISFVFEEVILVILIALGVLLLKSSLACIAAILLGLPLRISIMVGLGLSQVGEFSFILSEVGIDYGILDEDSYQMFLAVSVITMLMTPFLIIYGRNLADIVLRLPIPEKLKAGLSPISQSNIKKEKDHIIIVGFGVNGRNIARAAKAGGIPYVIIEINPDTVKRERANGEPIYYGDATGEIVLNNVNIRDARIIVSVINEPAANRRIVAISRRLNPDIYIITRTRYINEVKPLYEIGANEVVPEEFETSIEIFTMVLEKYLIPKRNIEELVAEARSDGYKLFRSSSAQTLTKSDSKIDMPGIKISTLSVAENSVLVGKSLANMDLRKQYGVLVLAIRRNSEIISNPESSMELYANDELFILGAPEKVSELGRLIANPE